MLALALSLLLAFAPQERGSTGSAAPPADPRVELELGIQRARAYLGKREWKAASKALDDLLRRFDGNDVARGKRVEIEEIARLAAFWSKHPAPNPKDLVGGELVQFDRTSDVVKLRYPAGKSSTASKVNAKAKWKRPKVSVPLLGAETKGTQRPPFPDFDQDDAFSLHPLQWNGPYTVEIKAKIRTMRDPAPVVVLALDDDDVLVGVIGSECRLERYTAGNPVPERLDSSGAPDFEVGRPYTLSVQMRERSVSINFNGRTMLSGAKPKESFGWFGFVNVRNIDSIVLAGKSYGQWIDALVDAAVQFDRDAFEREWKPSETLPAWLFSETTVGAGDAAAEKAAAELVEAGLQAERAKELAELRKKSEPLELLKFVDGLAETDVQPLARAWLRAPILVALGRLEEARAEAEAVCAAAPKHREMRATAAWLALRLEPVGVALAKARTRVEDFPSDADARELLVAALMRQGAIQEAAEVAEQALVEGIDREVAEQLVKRTRRALDGPLWRSSQRFESKHYVVTSDMDRDTCAKVGRILEDAHAFYAKVLGPIPEDRPRMRAFVFGGKQAYSDYCRDLVGDPAQRTLGMFDPSAAQLLLWNATEREDFLDTVRHEGFHQYLHALVSDVPTWLNEGLAKYFETAHRDKGALVVGNPPDGVAATLAELEAWPSVATLFATTRETFYGDNAPTWYSYSWCVLHTLAHGPKGDRKIFDALLASLGRGVDGAVAVREAFEGVDLERLLTRVQQHARDL